MVMTGKRRSGPDIWPETSHQVTSIEEMILTIWYKEPMKQSRIYLQQYYPTTPSAKEAHYTSYTSPNKKNSYPHSIIM